jgi:aminoglycoside/choline kinase family phosphotransferase
LYEREACFYLELAEALPVRTPRCFHAAYERDPRAPDDVGDVERVLARLPIWLTRLLVRLGEWLAKRSPLGAVLILEDLTGLRAGDQLEGGDARDWGLAIDGLAQLHASAWQREDWLSRDWVARMRPNVRLNQALFSRNYKRMSKVWTDRLGDDGRRVGEWIIEHGIPMMEALTSVPDTFCHGDYRLDNLFFDDTRDEVVMLDWQLPTRGPGVFDLAYFLSGVMLPDVDTEQEETWVRRYHDGLLSHGVSDYTWAACIADYRLAGVACWQRCIASASAVEPGDARGMAMLESWWDRMQARLEGVDPDAILRAHAT